MAARSPSLQGVRTAVSDAVGFFRLPVLPVGIYDLAFELSGFEKLTLTGNDVRLGATIVLSASTVAARSSLVVLAEKNPTSIRAAQRIVALASTLGIPKIGLVANRVREAGEIRTSPCPRAKVLRLAGRKEFAG